MTRSLLRTGWLPAAIAAGLAGAATITAFAAFTEWRIGGSLSDTLTFLASAAGGDQAVGTPWTIPLGALVLCAAAIAWAIGYVHAALRQPQLLTRPVLSGAAFGVVVWLIGFVVLVLIGKFHPPSLYSLDTDLLGFTFFFGVPLALVASRLLRPR